MTLFGSILGIIQKLNGQKIGVGDLELLTFLQLALLSNRPTFEEENLINILQLNFWDQ